MVLVSISFLSRTLFNIISCLILTNNNKEKKLNFWENHGLTCKKCDLGDLKCLSPKKVFFLSRILLIIISFFLRL